MKKILSHLKTSSSIRGIIAIMSVIGVSISPEQADAIITAAVTVYGAYQLLRKDSFEEIT